MIYDLYAEDLRIRDALLAGKTRLSEADKITLQKKSIPKTSK